jgi:hypothetical protein
MPPNEALRSASGAAALAPENCHGSRAGPELPGRSPSTHPAEDRETTWNERAEGLQFWRDISGIWPRSWWSPTQQWRDLLLRRYAREKVRELKALMD